MSSKSLYEKIVAQRPTGAGISADVRASTSIVPWRDGESGLEVYWVERSPELPFMGGFFAFPGGGLASSDRLIEVTGRPDGTEDAAVDGAMPSAVVGDIDLEPILVPGILTAALRELFEEVGILLATDDSTPMSRDDRERLLRGETTFGELIADRGCELDASSLVYAGRWLTPPLGPVRFDNRFFLLEWPQTRDVQPAVCGGELVSGGWIRPADAIERWREGHVVTAPPILHILEVLAVDGPTAGRCRLHEPAEKNLGPHRWIEFRPGVMLFPLRTPTLPPAAYTNAYALGTGEMVLVDPGSPYESETAGLVDALAELERRGRRFRAIWLTHHHPDHVGGVEALRGALGVPVCAHGSAAERLAERGITVDENLEDGQRIVLDGSPPFPVRVVHTPGHARGHVAFFDETFGSLLGGDLTAGIGTIVIDPPEGNMDDYLASLRRVSDLGARTLFPSHGPPTILVERKLREYIEHREWRESRILEAWIGGLRGDELLEHVYDDTPAVALPLARRQLLAHLERLQRAGLVRAGFSADPVAEDD
jgi:glyoxylase-like metal-dependent hydrolase (beta-lactamase superfamily II)/8-oxo-dGTP pyrophosphatase MutT (NUDIX family)